jgi:queuosine precursor transporter
MKLSSIPAFFNKREMNASPKASSRQQNLYLILSCIFITNALVAEFSGVKMFSAEKLLGFLPAHISLFGGIRLDFNMSVGVIIWPAVFILSDIVNEYFGKRGVRKLSYITTILVSYSFLAVLGGTKLPPADFWLQVNSLDSLGRPFDINYAYSTIFRQGLGIIVGSISAFLLSQLVDVYIFHYLRRLTGHRKLWLRATGSTIVSQLVDSFVILTIAFYFLGNWRLEQVFKVGIVQYFYKVFLAIALTPVIYVIHAIIDRYLGKETSEVLVEQADRNW